MFIDVYVDYFEEYMIYGMCLGWNLPDSKTEFSNYVIM